MKFKDLKRTIEILCSHYDDGIDHGMYCLHAEHDEMGFDFSGVSLTVEEIRELQRMGWQLGCGAIYDSVDDDQWNRLDELDDDDVLDLWTNYEEVYTFC